ncbi:MAG: ABC transporter ATP-binding protein [Acidimicrobiales bacterium]|jgi:ABC-type branched-subunit amino acid transport system ATPase component
MATATVPGATGATAGGPGPVALSAEGITVRFGGLTALSDVSLEVRRGHIVGLVGPNGAGKSTLLAVLSGLRSPDGGTVRLRGDDVTGMSARHRATRGLARTFQQPELFMGLTVREHLVLAYRARVAPHRMWRDMLDPRALFRTSAGETDKVDGLLELLHLTHVARAPVAALPLGVVRLVEVGRALASEPRVLLLDEPLSGLDLHGSENLVSVFGEIVRQSDDGLSLVIVEHDVAAVLALSDSVVVLDFGQRIAMGTPEEVRGDPAVRTAYLGDVEPPTRAATGETATAAPVDGDGA